MFASNSVQSFVSNNLNILLKAYMGKLVNDPLLRGTLINIAKYFASRRDIGENSI